MASYILSSEVLVSLKGPKQLPSAVNKSPECSWYMVSEKMTSASDFLHFLHYNRINLRYYQAVSNLNKVVPLILKKTKYRKNVI